MFEPAEVGAKLTDKAFAKIKNGLRLDLIEIQRQCLTEQTFPTLIVVAGVPGAGLVDTLNLLNTWMDPRFIATTVFDTPSDEERERPPFWRYWRSLPRAGRIGLYLGGWYEDPLREATIGHLSAAAYMDQLRRIAAFERTLCDDGALVLKFWLHLGEKALAGRRGEQRTDALVGLRPTDASLAMPGTHRALVRAASQAIEATAQEGASWHIVEGADDNHRRATVLGHLRDALVAHQDVRRKMRKRAAKLAEKERKKTGGKGSAVSLIAAASSGKNVLQALPTPSLTDAAYAKRFHELQPRIYDLHKIARDRKLSTVLVFEGWDAAGKGGTIRRLSYALNARNYKIIPIAAPNDEELAHHYLWRFWRELQRAGRMTIFDRSWYGRVLVERVEHLIDSETCTRAYREINAFEEELRRDGTLLLKFWLHITRDEQLRRFEERNGKAFKRWKLTDEDWRNRKRWDAYEAAINDMVAATSTANAPWHLVPSNCKLHARIRVLEVLEAALADALKGHARPRKAARRAR
jgi:polyphosphate:AMP phosphotransferase